MICKEQHPMPLASDNGHVGHYHANAMVMVFVLKSCYLKHLNCFPQNPDFLILCV